ncbi:MAG: EamA family transporter [Patescibacteria group bacterium]
MLSTIIPIASAFLAAIAGILARVLLKDTPAKKMLSINFLIMGATLLVISPFFYKFTASWQSVSIVLLIAIIDTLGNYFYFKTFEKTEASIALPLLSLAPVVTFFFGAIILNEYTSILKIISSLVIVVLIIVISIDWNELPKFRKATLYPALISAFLFGLSAIPSKYLLSTIHAINAPTLYMFRAILIGIFALMFLKNSLSNLKTKTYGFIFIRGLFVIGQWILLYYAITLGNTGVAVTLGNITPIFVLFLSLIFLKEKFNWKKALAAIAILAISFTL